MNTESLVHYEADDDTRKRINDVFTFHPVHGDQARRYTAIRGFGKMFALLLTSLCPPSRELTVAIRKIQEVVMYANAAIAINEKPDDDQDRVPN